MLPDSGEREDGSSSSKLDEQTQAEGGEKTVIESRDIDTISIASTADSFHSVFPPLPRESSGDDSAKEPEKDTGKKSEKDDDENAGQGADPGKS